VIYDFNTKISQGGVGAAPYLVEVVVHQPSRVHRTLPFPHGGGDRVPVRLPGQGRPEEPTERLSAVRVAAAAGGPHQGEGKRRLQPSERNNTISLKRKAQKQKFCKEPFQSQISE